MSSFQLAKSYLQYYFRAKKASAVTAPPAIAQFAEKVLQDRRYFYAFEEIERLRKRLLNDKKTIAVTDFGAGSRLGATHERRIRDITKTAATSPAYCELLFRMIQCYRPQHIVELGTSMGIATLYQAKSAAYTTVHTLEGCPQVAKRAQQHFDLLGVKNIDVHVGEFSSQLPKVIGALPQLDFVFFDGNHQYASTLQYFQQCLPKAHEGSLFIFDDIYWSAEMQKAWTVLKQHPKVTASIDLFFFGILFFLPQEKGHFTLIPNRWKPL
ncbi:MAG: class I SAM-dependent methyltransferase [Bacteroidota bacterium]